MAVTTRRRFLQVSGIGVVAGVAGCTDGGDGDEDVDTGGSTTNGGTEEDRPPDEESTPSTEESEDEDSAQSTDESEPDEITELEPITATADYYDQDHAGFSGEGADETDTWQHPGGMMVVDYEFEDAFEFAPVTEGADSLPGFSSNAGQASLGYRKLEAGTYWLDIDTDGSWTVTVARPDPPASAVQTPQVRATGNETTIVGPISFDGSFSASVSYSGDQYIVVKSIAADATSPSGETTLLSETGTVDNTTIDESLNGTHWINVQANDEWELSFE